MLDIPTRISQVNPRQIRDSIAFGEDGGDNGRRDNIYES
jgi:hypothetical protein